MARSKRRTSHGKEIYYILCIMFIVGFALFTILGHGGYLELKKARLELETHSNRADALKQENGQHRKTIQQLRSDKGALEKYAREKGYGKEGEIIQQVPEEKAPPKSPQPAKK
jgi:cell division protein FtsB